MNVAGFLERRSGRLLLALGRVVFWAAAATIAYALCRRGLTLGDEGYLLSEARDILAGKVPYRDFDLFVTPGVWYLIAGIFSFTGPSVIATRIAAAVCLMATMLVTRRIVRSCGSGLWGDFAAGLLPIFAVWAWPAWSFSFYSPWASMLALGALACTLEWMRSRRVLWLVACGAVLGLTIAFKQNYGVFAAAGCTAGLLLDEIAIAPALAADWRTIAKRFLVHSLLVALGGALVLVPAVAWLAREGALPAAFDSLVLRPFHGFVDAHSISFLAFGDLWRRLQMWSTGGLVYMAVPVTAAAVRVSWPSVAVRLVEIQHVALYWAPAFAFAGLAFDGLRKLRRGPSPAERALLVITVFAAAFFLGVFPRADYNHLINVYPPVLAMAGAAAAVHFGNARWRAGTGRRVAAGAAALSFLCFAGVAAVWMNQLRKIYWIPVNAPRAGVLLEPLEAEMLNREIEMLRGMTAEDEPVFALPGLSMIPFLAERPMPTRFYNYYSVHIGQDAGLEAAREIESSGAKVVLADYNNFFSDPEGLLTYGKELTDYLNRSFRPTYSLSTQSSMILTRRSEPLPAVPSREIWLNCDLRPSGATTSFVREHLLFRSLYHSFRSAWSERNQRLTICQLKVPHDAWLRLSLDLRQPTPATTPVNVDSQIWVFPDHGRPRRVLEHQWSVDREGAWNRNAGTEFHVDLSRWDDKVVTLILRTVVDGLVPASLIDPNGLSVMWNDARMESPDYADKAASPEASPDDLPPDSPQENPQDLQQGSPQDIRQEVPLVLPRDAGEDSPAVDAIPVAE